ncbi:MAG: 3-deoxy-D-manno-octulosonic acid kinase [Pseudomarimonas sp.]
MLPPPELIAFAPIEEMRVVTEAGDGVILFDATRIPQADPSVLDESRWPALGKRGRGSVKHVHGDFGAAVLRAYRRGGLIARINREHYVWTGEAQTRPFREFRLLATMRAQGLPVPAPLAAGFWRRGPFYRASILTAEIGGARTLAECLSEVIASAEVWRDLGTTLGRFHAAGICHADLNAHNLMIDQARQWWLLDFDRGVMRKLDDRWPQRRLLRLNRSLRKVGAAQMRAWPQAWQQLLDAHEQALHIDLANGKPST